MTELLNKIKILISNIKHVFYGKNETIELSLICFLAGGHLLLEDMPGVGKTTLARALAKSLDLEFKRIQFVPDLLPSDIIGVSIYNKNTNSFEFKKGPIFTNFLLLDEINRGNTRTQSATLEAMSQSQVSVDGKCILLPEPYFIVATQNPFDFEGTFPLPESQLDRFMMCLNLGYLDPQSELRMILNNSQQDNVKTLKPILDRSDCFKLRIAVKNITVDKDIVRYVIEIANRIRNMTGEIQFGVSQRGTLALIRAAQARAFINERTYCTPDDVKQLVGPVFAHRIKLTSGSLINGDDSYGLIKRIMAKSPVPV